MKLSEAIILGRSLVNSKEPIWTRCALGGAVKAATGHDCYGYDDVERVFPEISKATAMMIIRMFDGDILHPPSPIEQIADMVQKIGDVDSVNHNNSGDTSAQKTSSHCPSTTLSEVLEDTDGVTLKL